MSATPPTTELVLPLRLSEAARSRLTQRAAENGQDLATYASALVEQAVTRPSVDDLLSGYRRQVAESRISDDELDALHRDLLAKVRVEKKASPG